MKKHLDLQFRRDLIKLTCLTAAIAGTVAVFIVTPALSAPTLLSIVMMIILSPWAAALERRGYSRTWAIGIIFLTLFAALVIFGIWGIQASIAEWDSLKEKAPEHFQVWSEKVQDLEAEWRTHFSFLKSVHLTKSLTNWGLQTGRWFVDHGPALMGQFLSSMFIIPFLTFVLLNEGRTIQKSFFQLVPNRYFESFFLIHYRIFGAISDYIRAKLVEAALLGLMVATGLVLIKAPYVMVLGIFAGVTNIVPYVGPVLGAIPGIFAVTLDPQSSNMILPVALVYLTANLVDMIVIFPLVVAKLVKLHPFLLIAVVAVGQHYYGLVGMLISIPIATALKVVLEEVYTAVYEQRPMRGDVVVTSGDDTRT